MGFGTLFVGFFLLLNLSFYGFTDLLSGIVMLTAFYKLRDINRYFKASMISTAIFCGVGLVEFIKEILYFFGGGLDTVVAYLSPARFLLLGATVILMHFGIRDVAKEVDVPKTAKRAVFCSVAAYPTYILCAAEGVISLFFDEAPLALVIVRIALYLILLVLLVISLWTIYSAYMYICMPEDQNTEYVEKPSRFGFVNSFRKRQEAKNREYAEYKLNQMKKRADRKSGRKKK